MDVQVTAEVCAFIRSRSSFQAVTKDLAPSRCNWAAATRGRCQYSLIFLSLPLPELMVEPSYPGIVGWGLGKMAVAVAIHRHRIRFPYI